MHPICRTERAVNIPGLKLHLPSISVKSLKWWWGLSSCSELYPSCKNTGFLQETAFRNAVCASVLQAKPLSCRTVQARAALSRQGLYFLHWIQNTFGQHSPALAGGWVLAAAICALVFASSSDKGAASVNQGWTKLGSVKNSHPIYVYCQPYYFRDSPFSLGWTGLYFISQGLVI